MDQLLLNKVRELAKDFSKQTTYRGNIADDRMRPLKESCFEEGAKQMYELLKSESYDWETPGYTKVTKPLIVGHLEQDENMSDGVFLMVPSGGFKFIPPNEPIPIIGASAFSPDRWKGKVYTPFEIEKEAADLVSTLDNQAPNDERSVATDVKPKRKASASKKKKP